MSTKTALYRFFTKDDELLYVGISVNPFNRAERHRINEWDAVSRITIEWFDTREEAKQIEAVAIRNEKPFFNDRYEVINFEEWRIYAFCNKQWPYNVPNAPDGWVKRMLAETRELSTLGGRPQRW